MNILFISDRFPVNGGIETVTRTLANAFAERGYKVTVCCRLKTIKEAFVDNRIEQYKFPKTNDNIDSVYAAENIDFLRHLFIEKNIDILISQHAFGWQYNKLCVKAKLGLNIKFIQCLHFNIFWFLYRKFTIYLPFFILKPIQFFRTLNALNTAIKNSDKLVLLSEEYVKQCKNLLPWRNLNSVIAMPNPMIGLNKEAIDLEQKEKIILYVGRMVESQKRMSKIIKCWSLICDKYKDWKLVFVGDGPDLEKIKKLAENLPRVYFEGYQNPTPYYLKASIFLMTSAYEGFPMIFLECMQFGVVPVVMNNFVAACDLVKNEETGFLTKKNDLKDFTDKVENLMGNKNMREDMAKEGFEFAEKFSLENIVDKWEKLFLS